MNVIEKFTAVFELPNGRAWESDSGRAIDYENRRFPETTDRRPTYTLDMVSDRCLAWDCTARIYMPGVGAYVGRVLPSGERQTLAQAHPHVAFDHSGKVSKFSIVGSYPIMHVTTRNRALCVDCVQRSITDHDDVMQRGESIAAHDMNYSNPSLDCDNCDERIESAYAEDKVGT